MSCPECVTGFIHNGTPKGTEVKVGGINAYTVGPEDSKRVIVFGTDIFGWRLVNARLLADEYASKGFRVVIPDLFSGWQLPQWTINANDQRSFHEKSFLQRYVAIPASIFLIVPLVIRNMSKQIRIITKVASALRDTHPAGAKFGYVGFCWGGRFAFTQNALFDATVACHPSLVQFPGELNAISKPFSLAAAANDPYYNKKRAEETEKILAEKGLKDVEVKVYEGINHGWAVRSNLEVEREKKAFEETLQQVVGWFEKHLTPAD
ncbi:hypothetical protein V8D89_012447 [Ganoderma adspersum]